MEVGDGGERCHVTINGPAVPVPWRLTKTPMTTINEVTMPASDVPMADNLTTLESHILAEEHRHPDATDLSSPQDGHQPDFSLERGRSCSLRHGAGLSESGSLARRR